MSILATDNFNRADSGNLGTNWTIVTSMGGFTIVANEAKGTANCGEYYNAVIWPNDQYAQCVLKTMIATTDEGPGPRIRMATNLNTAYFLQANTTEIRLYKVVSSGYTQLGSDLAGGAVNDILRLEAKGSTIIAKKNGATISTQTDNAIASGNAGLWDWDNSASATIDDWEGGDFLSAAPFPPFPQPQKILLRM